MDISSTISTEKVDHAESLPALYSLEQAIALRDRLSSEVLSLQKELASLKDRGRKTVVHRDHRDRTRLAWVEKVQELQQVNRWIRNFHLKKKDSREEQAKDPEIRSVLKEMRHATSSVFNLIASLQSRIAELTEDNERLRKELSRRKTNRTATANYEAWREETKP